MNPNEEASHLSDTVRAAVADTGHLPLDGLGMVRFMDPETGYIGHAFIAFGGRSDDALDPIAALGLHAALGVWVDSFAGQYLPDDDD